MLKDQTIKQMSLLEDSHVNLSPLQEKEKEQMMIATSGMKLLELSKNVNLDGSLGKMLKVLLTSTKAWSSDRCKMIWKEKVSKSNVSLFQLQASVHGIKEKESGSLGAMYPTPTTMDHIDRKGMRPSRAATNRKSGYLSEMIKMYPTPAARDYKDSTVSKSHQKRNSDSLPVKMMKMYGTPKAQDNRAALWDRGKGNLGEQVHGENNARETGGRLNPNFVEFLMGYPMNWTKIEPTE